jgi:hypothetical protein
MRGPFLPCQIHPVVYMRSGEETHPSLSTLHCVYLRRISQGEGCSRACVDSSSSGSISGAGNPNPWIPHQHCLFTPELQRQSRGKRRVLQGGVHGEHRRWQPEDAHEKDGDAGVFCDRHTDHTGPIRRVIRSAGNLCLWHRL